MNSRVNAAEVGILAVLVFVAWLLLSGHFSPFLLSIGLLATAFAVLIALRMQLVDDEGVPLASLSARVWTYLPWLLLEVVKSNVAVARIILGREIRINPTMKRFQAIPRTDLGRFILANSITLTPGTITTGIVGGEFEVHALVAEFLDGIEENEMNRRVAGLEKPSEVR